MKALKIKRQAYFGGTFVGNDCMRILSNAKLWGHTIRPRRFRIRQPKENTVTTALIPPNHEHVNKYRTLFNKLHQCVVLYSAPRPLCCHEIRMLEVRCASIGNWLPRDFPNESLPPKFHLLTHHIPSFAARWQSVGLSAEHSIESSHRIFNRLGRTYATVANTETRLQNMLS